MNKKVFFKLGVCLFLCLIVGIGYAQQPIQKLPTQKLPPIAPRPLVKEECYSFNLASTSVVNKGGNWVIVDSTKPELTIASFPGNQKADADRALDIIKKYGMNQVCFARPGVGFQYELVNGQAPTGTYPNEVYKDFNPEKLSVSNIQGKWKIVEGANELFDFGASEAQARLALAMIKKYGFTRSCSVGRPVVGFKYMTKKVVTTTPVSAVKDFEGKIRLDRTQYGSTHPIKVNYTLTNYTAETLSVLKWHTPLEGLRSNIFHVERSGKRVPYVGIVAKRGAPLPEDYVTLGPGKSVSVEMDLSEAYDITTPGDYTVRLVSGALRVGQEKPAMKVAQPKFIMKGIQSDTVSFKLVQERKSLIRVLPSVLRPFYQIKPKAKVIPDLTATTRGAVGNQHEIVNVAHKEAVSLALNSRFVLLGTADSQKPNAIPYKTWFGSYDTARWWKVTEDFDKIYQGLYMPLVFDCTGQGCNNNWYAYVRFNEPYVIHLCPLFWSAPNTGTDSKAGTIIHELSHHNWVSGTSDFEYGTTDCQSLATQYPEDAIKNADSHEYFAEGLTYLGWESPGGQGWAQYAHFQAPNGWYMFGDEKTGLVHINPSVSPPATFLMHDVTPPPSLPLRSGNQVRLILRDRVHYVSDIGGGELRSSSTVAGQSETFQIIKVFPTLDKTMEALQKRDGIYHGDLVALRTNKGFYLGFDKLDPIGEFGHGVHLSGSYTNLGELQSFGIFLPCMGPVGGSYWHR